MFVHQRAVGKFQKGLLLRELLVLSRPKYCPEPKKRKGPDNSNQTPGT